MTTWQGNALKVLANFGRAEMQAQLSNDEAGLPSRVRHMILGTTDLPTRNPPVLPSKPMF